VEVVYIERQINPAAAQKIYLYAAPRHDRAQPRCKVVGFLMLAMRVIVAVNHRRPVARLGALEDLCQTLNVPHVLDHLPGGNTAVGLYYWAEDVQKTSSKASCSTVRSRISISGTRRGESGAGG
jgi:hypothetical protein